MNRYDYGISIINKKIALKYSGLRIVNTGKTNSFRRSLCLNASLVIVTLILGTFGSLAKSASSFAEEPVEVGVLSLTTQHQPHSQENIPTDREEKVLDFSDTGRSGQQTAGETRSGQCREVSFPLTALVPSSHSGKTIATHPKLWFYVPYSAQDISKIEFVIQDAERKDISRQILPLQSDPGYLSASLPGTLPGLENGKSYRWYFKVYCQQNSDVAPIFVQGWIDKIAAGGDKFQQVRGHSQKNITEENSVVAAIVDLNELELDSREESSPHMFYARNELWFDAIDSLLNSYLIDPNNSTIRDDWKKLIQAKGADLELPELDETSLFVQPD